MGKFNTINEAIRSRIDILVEEKGLDAKDYPYSSDAAESLNQLKNILGVEADDSQNIADALDSVLGAVGSSGEGGEDEMCFVEFTESWENDTVTYTFKKTYDEIHELCKNGKCLGAVRILDDGGRITRTIYWLHHDSEYEGRIQFTNVNYANSGSEGYIEYFSIYLWSNGEIQDEHGSLLTNVRS